MTDYKRTISVTRSRKLSLSNYGGNNYETEDFTVSQSYEIPKETPDNLFDDIYKHLLEDCEAKLREVVKNRISELVTPKEKPVDAITLAKAPLKTFKLEKASENKLTKAQKNNVRVENFKKENPDTPDNQPF